MVRVRLALAVAAVAVLLGCGGASEYGDTNEYGEAAGGLVIGVAATGANRAANGDCWGRCSPGYSCNRTSGFCERGDCDPACPGGMTCTLSPAGPECRGDPAPIVEPY